MAVCGGEVKGGRGYVPETRRLGLRLPNRMDVVCGVSSAAFTIHISSFQFSWVIILLPRYENESLGAAELRQPMLTMTMWAVVRPRKVGKEGEKKKDGKGSRAMHSSHRKKRSMEREGLFVGGFFYFPRFLKFSCALCRAAYVACSVYACVCVFVCVLLDCFSWNAIRKFRIQIQMILYLHSPLHIPQQGC